VILDHIAVERSSKDANLLRAAGDAAQHRHRRLATVKHHEAVISKTPAQRLHR
jgi:hypothetical protein